MTFIDWCESREGKLSIGQLTFLAGKLEDKGYRVECWPNKEYPYEVTIESPVTLAEDPVTLAGPKLELLKEPYMYWPIK